MGDDGDSGWESNILRNTQQIAASVARGLISLVAFDDDMDPEAIAVLQGTKVKATGNELTISLSIDPDVIVAALDD